MALSFHSKHVLVIDEETGSVILEKNSESVAPIASLTKLMTAMVVLDAHQDMDEMIVIEAGDVDKLKHSTSRVPVGITLPRKTVLELALMSSDNRAAAALARTYPGSNNAFKFFMNSKIKSLGLSNTTIQEPTGLSPENTSTANDLAKIAKAASKYPDIEHITTSTNEMVEMNGREVNYRNTNRFVGQKGWSILLSKTGYTKEAGRCIIMRLHNDSSENRKNVIMVLLNSESSGARTNDALKVKRYLSGDTSESPERVVTRAKRGGKHTVLASSRKSKKEAKSHTKLAAKETKQKGKIVTASHKEKHHAVTKKTTQNHKK